MQQEVALSRRVYLSFSSEDTRRATAIRSLQWNPSIDIEFVGRHATAPKNSEDAEYIRDLIRRQLANTAVTVVLIGDKTAASDWVDFEVRESISRGREVIGVKLKKDARVPPVLIEARTRIIDWAPRKVSSEIERAVLLAGSPQRMFTAILQPAEEGGFVIKCLELPVATQGNSKEEAMLNMREAIEGFLEVRAQKLLDQTKEEKVQVIVEAPSALLT